MTVYKGDLRAVLTPFVNNISPVSCDTRERERVDDCYKEERFVVGVPLPLP